MYFGLTLFQRIATAQAAVTEFVDEVVSWIEQIAGIFKEGKGGVFTRKIWEIFRLIGQFCMLSYSIGISSELFTQRSCQ